MSGKTRRRGSLLLPLVLVAAGIVLLLTNLGLIEGLAWRDLLRFWPVLLIVAGIDLIVGRASVAHALSVLVVSCVFAAAAFAAFQLFAPDEWVTRTETVRYVLADIDTAHIDISCQACAVSIERSEGEDLAVTGSLDLRSDERLTQSVRKNDRQLTYGLRSEKRFSFRIPWSDRDDAPWQLQMPSGLPVTLSVTSDAFDLDLRGLAVSSLDLDGGSKGGDVVLSDVQDTAFVVSSGDIVFHVPSGVGVELTGATSTTVDVPDDFVGSDGTLRSHDFDSATVRSTIVLRPGAGSVRIAAMP